MSAPANGQMAGKHGSARAGNPLHSEPDRQVGSPACINTLEVGHRLKLNHKAMRMQYICRISILSAAMSLIKDETLSIRTSSEIKQLVRKAAERERRSVSSMIEILVLDYARQHKLQPDQKQSALSDRRPIVSIKKEKNVDPNN